MTHKNALIVRKAALALAIAVAWGTSANIETAHAAGLGALTVQSALGQPLKAEIELSSVTPEELQTLSVRLASQQVFKQAGIEFSAVLSTLRFVVDKRDGRDVIRISSTQAINEPFVDLLVELNWATGRIVREYTFLLDPPELRLGKEPEAIAPLASVPVPAPEPTPALAPSPSVIPPASSPVPNPTRVAEPVTQAKIKVKSGDSLSKIAARHLPDGVTLDQMLVALYRANPNSFVGNNMNRLKVGAILRLPEPSAVLAVPAPEARKEVAVQSKDFANYRSNLAGLVAKSTSSAAVAEPKSVQGQVTAKVEDQVVPKTETKDQVKLARPETSTTPGASPGGNTTTKTDTNIAKEKALNEANQRVAELERNVGEIQKLLTKQNETLAKAQEAAASKVVTPPPVKAEAPKAEAPKAEAPKAEAPKAEAPKAEAPKATPVKTEPPKAPVPTAPTEDKDIFAQLLENPLILGGVALFLGVAGGGLTWYRRRQAKKLDEFHDSVLSSGDLKSNSIFGAGAAKPVDSNDSSFNSRFTPSASQIDSNEVDPIAEADVYIAYGRDAQAEEILKEAMKISPNRQTIRLKLLEIYASRKDLGAFSSLAGELYQQTNGEGNDWERASELGRSIDSKNPLYTPQNESPKETQAVTPAVSESSSSDFGDRGDDISASIPVDFDLGTPSQSFAPAAPVKAISSQSQDSFRREEPRLVMTENPALEATQPTPALDFNLDTPSSVSSGVVAVGDRVESPKLSLDFDLNLPTIAPTPSPITPVDLSSISLDLDSGKATELSLVDSTAAEPLGAKQQEMATKLDLAAAYLEIGDREGAQELLEEVLRGGDSEQQSRAKKLLESIV